MEINDIIYQLLQQYNLSKDDITYFRQVVLTCCDLLSLKLESTSDLSNLEKLLQITSVIVRYRKEHKLSLDLDSISFEICTRFSYFDDIDEGKVFLSDSKLQYQIMILNCSISYFSKINRPTSKKNPAFSLLNDLFQTTFDKLSGYCKMMALDLYLDGYVAWRTIHESESILTLLVNNKDQTRNAYLRHIEYLNMFYNPELFDDEYRNKIFDQEIKYDMSKHDLKSKDMKKYLEYGWLFSCKEYDIQKHPTFKLNFNDGVDELAGLREKYNEYYKGTSELAHSSSIYFYANASSIKDVSLMLVFQSASRVYKLYMTFMEDYFNKNEKQKEMCLKIIDEIDEISSKLNKDFE